ncbi:MAG: DUF5610 domain-containing protein [Bdellovibrionota bacterium]|nr:MAG: DUF5610 domain-containing protein [Bdellovibrionota bacterium]
MERLTQVQLSGDRPNAAAASQQADLAVLQASVLKKPSEDATEVSINKGALALGLTAEEILARINGHIDAIIKKREEAGIPFQEALPSQEGLTPEKTASWVVRAITSLYPQYRAERQNLSEQEVLAQFMSAVREGVKQGYEDASGILEALGAFEVDGVRESVDETMSQIEKQLQEFERRILGLEEPIEEPTSTDGLTQEVEVEVLPGRNRLELVA